MQWLINAVKWLSCGDNQQDMPTHQILVNVVFFLLRLIALAVLWLIVKDAVAIGLGRLIEGAIVLTVSLMR